MNLSQSLSSKQISTKPSVSIEGATLEYANIKALPPEVVIQLDDWMESSFKSYKWLRSPQEADVDFVIARLEGKMIGRAAVVTREARLDGQPIMIMGLGGVLVDDAYQGKKLGNELMVESMHFVEKNPVDFCILMCEQKLEGLYQKFGFRTIAGKALGLRNAIFLQPDGQKHEYKPEKGISMVYEKNGKVWAGGILDLVDLPF